MATTNMAPLIRNQAPPLIHQPPPPPSSSSETNFPILAISILGMLTTAILLVSYYVFVIKCCRNCHRSGIISRLMNSFRSRRRRPDEPFWVYSPPKEYRGLEESVIRAIPIIRFRRNGYDGGEMKSLIHECAVCLNKFQEEERIRLLPNCSHGFHIDCIDTWLQTNANCPLCRSEITSPIPTDQFMTHQIPLQNHSVMVQVRDDAIDLTPSRTEVSVQSTSITTHQDPSPWKPEQRFRLKEMRKFHHVSSMGDECIDVRGKDDDDFSIQPLRRSFSMDSSCDRQLYLSVQEILQHKHLLLLQEAGIGDSSSGICGNDRVRRSFFSFGHGRSSRNAVLPVPIQP